MLNVDAYEKLSSQGNTIFIHALLHSTLGQSNERLMSFVFVVVSNIYVFFFFFCKPYKLSLSHMHMVIRDWSGFLHVCYVTQCFDGLILKITPVTAV